MAAFTFDGKVVPFEPGDTFAAAMHRAGIRVLSRSLKYHRPRGLYCNAGSCASCFVGADGVPNVPACMTAAREGACLVSQNRIGSAKHDLLGVVDKVYRRGFDPHDAFTRSRFVNAVFLKGVRFMSGLGKPPSDAAAAQVDAAGAPLAAPTRHVLQVDELIIGAGRAGLLRAKEAAAGLDAARPGRRILLVDEAPRLGGSAHWDVLEAPTRQLAGDVPLLPGVECWTEALCFGLYPAEQPVAVAASHDASLATTMLATRAQATHVAAIRRMTPGGEQLWEVRAARITIAAGSHDMHPTFVNNDLPGVMTYRGAMRLAREQGVRPGARAVVHGAPLPRAAVAALQQAGCEVVAAGTVSEVRGSDQVVRAQVDGQWYACDTVLCHLPLAPRIELYQQAGCALAWRGAVLAPRHAGGATSVTGVHAALPEASA